MEIGLPRQGDFFEVAQLPSDHASKAKDGSCAYKKIISKALRDQVDNMLEDGYILKVMADFDNHFHLAIGSGGDNYMRNTSK